MLTTTNTLKETIHHIKSNSLQICIRGTGRLMLFFYDALVKSLGVKIDYFVDKNPEKWGTEIMPGVVCRKLEAIKEGKIACIVMIAGDEQQDAMKEMNDYGYNPVIGWKEFFENDIICDIFSALKFEDCWREFNAREKCYKSIKTKGTELQAKNNLVIYTCITGGYDDIIEPEYILDQCDYYVISDQKPQKDTVYKWISIDDIVPPEIDDNFRKNRYCKLNPHLFFPNHRYSLYHDGNMTVTGDIKAWVDILGKTGICLCKHPRNKNIFEEGFAIIDSNKDDSDIVLSQIGEYIKEGITAIHPMYACGVLFREHNLEICSSLMTQWWKEVYIHSYRDQLSLPYIVWKNRIKTSEIGVISGDVYNLELVKYNSNHNYLH